MPLSSLTLALLLFQAPGDGWAMVQGTREVKKLYWELFETTEIWIRLIPEDPDGKPPLVNLIFQAFFPGRAERDPYTGLPRDPKGPPARIVVQAQPLPLTVIRELSLRLVIDGRRIDLTGPTSRYRNLPCLVANGDCAPNAVEAELEPSALRSLIAATSVRGEALGFPIKLTDADRTALAEFATRIGLPPGK
jgi:hypothetical protein